MTSPAEVQARIQSEETDRKFSRAIRRDLPAALSLQQIEFQGFSLKITPSYYLLTLRVKRQGVKQVAFVGADSVRSVFIKAATLARHGKLSWQADKYASDEV